ncbi:hypothetical protein DICPUDRAFT_39301 [Dictyostelium purpureum]|uniref:Large ribosomal subunit protein uL3m n=1 Tax=Dictyostelium purpureum TaxID=5786 RepID=F0ZW28_DICPU|nr:uncharacterized protein DICPUDRAFT_39301 [Dictyostelium purpureum]EGC31848.1 hypothetical protein DICPUDRAFT_39301 [Dictyostelium purpureum]|eukprot:XP_003291618.1 hypothetical protein DICPUDRAFT_39301 [Dictyostelium purpureum]
MDKIINSMRKITISNESLLKRSIFQRPVTIPKPSFGQKISLDKLKRDKESGWTIATTRMGAIGKKVGMMTTYIGAEAYPVTVIQIPNNQVTQVKRKIKDGANMVQIGADEIRMKNVPKPLRGHFAKANVTPKRILMEFKVTNNALNIDLGTPILARHFVPGQLVTVKGKSSGKGFAGGMKRWNFRGQPATHGVSLTHRSIGATGNRQTPGRVFKNRKMPGRLGGESCTVKNLQILKINNELNCIMVKGAVPGKKGSYLKIIDSTSMKWREAPPFPTYTPTPVDLVNTELVFKPNTQEIVSEELEIKVAPKLISQEEASELLNAQKEVIAKKLQPKEKNQE